MKLYCFYIHDDNLYEYYGLEYTDIKRLGNIKYALYGWTTSKTIAKKFKNERNERIFLMKVFSVNEADLEDFLKENSLLKIDNFEYLTEVIMHNGTRVIRPVNIVSTVSEHDCCTYSIDPGLLDGENLLSIFDSYESCELELLKPSILNYLFDVLKIEGVYNLIYTFTERPETSVYFNQLTIFCKLFSNTFNERMIK